MLLPTVMPLLSCCPLATTRRNTKALVPLPEILGMGDTTGVECHLNARRAATGIDNDCLAEVDREIQPLPYSVRSIHRQIDMDHTRRCGVIDISLRQNGTFIARGITYLHL